jgi:hypothetical protein
MAASRASRSSLPARRSSRDAPSCLNVTMLATTIESVLDAGNALTYCASPSGAFVE